MTPADAADLVMERLVFSRHDSPSRAVDRKHNIDLWKFKDVDASGLIDGASRFFLVDRLGEAISFDPETIWPFSAQMAAPASDGWPNGSLQVTSAASCDTRVARAYGSNKFSSRMALLKVAILMPGERHESCFSVHAFINGQWIGAKNSRSNTRLKGDLQADHNRVCVCQSLALTQRYEWAVSVGLGSGPKVRFGTDPSGIRAMFRDRDKPEDRERRSPLRHWVREHWRQKRSDPLDLAFIREHMRGITTFDWYGYSCILRPSAYDLERIEQVA